MGAAHSQGQDLSSIDTSFDAAACAPAAACQLVPETASRRLAGDPSEAQQAANAGIWCCSHHGSAWCIQHLVGEHTRTAAAPASAAAASNGENAARVAAVTLSLPGCLSAASHQ